MTSPVYAVGFSLVALWWAAAGQVRSPANLPGSRSAWEQVIQDTTSDYDYRAAAAAVDGGVWVVAGERPKGQMAPPQRFGLWRVGEVGDVGPRIELEGAMRQGTSDAPRPFVFGLAAVANNLALVARGSNGGPSLLSIDGSSNRLVRETRISASSELAVTKVLRAADGNVLVMGSSAGGGWLSAIDPSGTVVWQKSLTSVGVSSVVDAVRLNDGSVAVLGGVAGSGTSATAWVGRVSAQGDVVSGIKLNRTVVGLAALRGGGLVLVEERYAANGKEVAAQVLSANFEERQRVALASDVKGAFPFKITSLGDGALVVGYTKDHLPWVAQVTADARIEWSETRRYDPKQVPVVGRLDCVSTERGAIVLFTLAVVDDKGEQRQTVRAVKYEAP